MQAMTDAGWHADVERGPDWLFVRLHAPMHNANQPIPLAEYLWALMQQNLTQRLVLEMESVPILYSHLLGQLLMISKRVRQRDGILRLCGVSEMNSQVLRTCRLEHAFPVYRDRAEAVMGYRPPQPR